MIRNCATCSRNDLMVLVKDGGGEVLSQADHSDYDYRFYNSKLTVSSTPFSLHITCDGGQSVTGQDEAWLTTAVM